MPQGDEYGRCASARASASQAMYLRRLLSTTPVIYIAWWRTLAVPKYW
jgi:hypothetical protein